MITLKRTTPKNLATIGNISNLAKQALKEIGKRKVESWEENKTIQVLKKEDQSKLKQYNNN